MVSTISIVIPVYNRERYLGAAIKSILKRRGLDKRCQLELQNTGRLFLQCKKATIS
jgi:GT2 family glycosyltransferase